MRIKTYRVNKLNDNSSNLCVCEPCTGSKAEPILDPTRNYSTHTQRKPTNPNPNSNRDVELVPNPIHKTITRTQPNQQ